MNTISPMLACHGGITLGPGLTMLIVCVLVLWVAAILMAIPNLFLILRAPQKPGPIVGHSLFYLAYFCSGVALFTGSIFEVEPALGILSIFLIPVMAVGQFIFLFRGWRRERKAKQVEN